MAHTPFRLAAWFSLCLPMACSVAEEPLNRVDRIYEANCASCHGQRLEGGLGSNLIDGVWKHGGTDQDIRRTIENGIPDMGMVPYKETLTPEQIRGLVVFIREKEKAETYSKTKFPEPEPGKITKTQHHSYKIETVAEGLDIPWSLAFLPDGRMLVTERPGPVRIIERDGKVGKPIEGLPEVVHHGQGGMMEVAVHPDYAQNGWIYLGLADGTREGGKVKTLTAIVRGRIKDNKWADQEWIYKADERFYTGAGVHFGTRIVFHEGYIYFVVGERGGMMEVQDVTRPNGKIFRLHDDGRIPDDNPFVDKPDAEKGIWTYGHRNPQGLALDKRTGDLYATEHGPRGGDEFNLIKKGANYGWPVITYGMNYNGTPMTGITEKEGMEQPVIHWTPSIAACGLAFYDGKAFPKWTGNFFAGGLASQELRRLKVEDRKVVEQEVVMKGIGRIRDVRSGPDGAIYVVLNDPGKIIRMVPAED
jgi:glucose/arabinose dehydrogenase